MFFYISFLTYKKKKKKVFPDLFSMYNLVCSLKVILGEEVAASKLTLFDITKQICDAVQARAGQGLKQFKLLLLSLMVIVSVFFFFLLLLLFFI
jgi:hypothetical protein